MYNVLCIVEKTRRKLLTIDQNIRAVYANMRAMYPNKRTHDCPTCKLKPDVFLTDCVHCNLVQNTSFTFQECEIKHLESNLNSKRPRIGFKYRLSLNAGQTYCRMLKRAFCNISTFIKLPFV